MEQYPICIVGSVAYDNIMKFPSKFSDQFLPSSPKIDTCFVVETREVFPGGTAANLAIGLKRLGVNALILSKVGEDIGDYRRDLIQKGIQTEGLEVVKGEKTLAVFIVTDCSGDQITVIHPGAFAHMSRISLRSQHLFERKTQLVIINPLIAETSWIIAQQCLDLKIPYVFDPGQNLLTIPKEHLLQCARNAKYFICNNAEFLQFLRQTSLAKKEATEIADIVVVTNGSNGSIVYHNSDSIVVPAVKPVCLKDPTGAGDAYRAGFFTGVLKTYPLEICAQMGGLAGTYCVEGDGPQGISYSYDEFKIRFKQVWGKLIS